MSEIHHLNLSKHGLVFDPRTGESYQLNPVAQKIIVHFQSGKDTEETAKLLSHEFEIPLEQAFSDILEFQVQLSIIGLVA
jgi:hypothetical protein